MKDVCELTRPSRATIYGRMWHGEFPQPKRIGSRTVRWPLSAVRAWVHGLPAHRY
ncbi:MAG: AlpA family phage regulatory protein [Spiribacter salinus]|uniref:AlpA family phage regulatory protein n=1 Tax=Spiribacter salinus TaxID=1335746 RepID=A0A540V929_9GAMM|nr:MAG: AlpA family phage regulatory protein [Spiribacter salinus]